MKKRTILFCFLLFIVSPLFCQNTITITAGFLSMPLSSYAQLLFDQSQSLSIEDVASPDRAEEFAPINYNREYPSGTYWVKCALFYNPASGKDVPVVLDLCGHETNYEAIFLKTPEGRLTREDPGLYITRNHWKDRIHRRAIGFSLPPGESALFFKMKVDGSINVPFILYNLKAFFFLSEYLSVWYLILIGITVGILLYNVFLFFVYHDKTTVYFVGMLIFFLNYIVEGIGVYEFYFPIENSWLLDRMLYASVIWGMFFMVLFIRESLESYKTMPKMDRLLLILHYSLLLFFFSLLVLDDFSIFAYIWFFWELVVFLSCLAVIVLGTVRKQRTAYFLLVAWGIYIILVLITLVQSAGYIPTNAITKRAGDFGAVFPLVLMAASVGDKMNTLRREKDQIKKLDALKTGFFTNISHEVRTPLQLIQAPVEDISRGKYGKRVPANHYIFDIIRRNCQRLNNLITNILDYSSLEFTRPEPKLVHVDLLPLVRAFYEEAHLYADSKNIQYSFIDRTQNPAGVLLDVDMFEKAFFNLLSNAFKSVGAGGFVTVTCHEASHGNIIGISVADTGIGIPETEIPKLFDRYSKVDEKHQHLFEGSGIGLSIVKDVMTILHGTIEVHSEVGVGSSFTLWFPLKPLPKMSAPPAARKSRPRFLETKTVDIKTIPFSNQKNTLLVVEDNRDMLFYLVSRLQKEYNVLFAQNGQEALNVLAANDLPDLIISDLLMPVMDGKAFFRELQKNDDLKGTPFIFLTAVALKKEYRENLASGALDYIVKPFAFDELTLKIKTVLQNFQLFSYRIKKHLKKETERKIKTNCKEYNITPREEEILDLVFIGKQNRSIADTLNISPNTVKRHMENIYQKTGSENRFELYARLSEING